MLLAAAAIPASRHSLGLKRQEIVRANAVFEEIAVSEQIRQQQQNESTVHKTPVIITSGLELLVEGAKR